MLAAATAVLQLTIDPATIPSDVSLRTVTKEVRDIWRPHVDVVFVTKSAERCITCDHSLDVHFSDAPPVAGLDTDLALAWIEFVAGRPASGLSVSVARARRVLADGMWMGRPLRALPGAVQTRFLSIAVGRALAHEIGHYILRSPWHQPDGLMRARFTLRDLMDPKTARFRPTPIDLARLMATRSAAGMTDTTEWPPLTKTDAVSAR